MSILIFTLVFSNFTRLTLGIPTAPIEFPDAFQNVKEILQPSSSRGSSSWTSMGLGEMIQLGVQSVQNVIKYVIGVEDRPREFYIVHIKDEKNPNNDKDVLREKGHEGKNDDIPLKGGKLPGNSIINPENPVIEYVGSFPEQTTPQTSPSTIAASGTQTSPVESRSQHGNNNESATPTTDNENKNHSPGVDLPHTNEITKVKSPSVSTDTSAQNSSKEGFLKPVQQSAPVQAVSKVEKIDQNLPKQETGDSPEHTSQGLQNLGDLSPKRLENLTLVFPIKETQWNEFSSSSKPIQDHNSKITIDEKIVQPQALVRKPTPQFVNSNSDLLGGAELDMSKILDPLAIQATKKATTVDDEFPKHLLGANGTPSRKVQETQPSMTNEADSHILKSTQQDTQEPLPSDSKKHISVKECETNFEAELCEKNPELCDQFRSEEEITNYEKKNSGFVPNGQQKTPSAPNNPNKSANPHQKPTQQDIQEPLPTDSQKHISVKECETKFEKELCGKDPELCDKLQSQEEFTDYVKNNSNCEATKTPSPIKNSDESAEPVHPSNPNELISMNDCEIKYGIELCEKYPDLCSQFQSNEQFIDYIKKYSGCETDKEQKTPSPTNVPDESEKLQSFDPNKLISLNECETEYERELCEEYFEFCSQFQSKEEFIDYVKRYSGCEAGGQKGEERYPSTHDVDKDPSHREHQPNDPETPKNFNENDELSTSPLKSVKFSEKEKGGTKKKTKSSKEKRSNSISSV